jgi:multidrug efflux pump subunit AcrA (membrane-fusion protein)
VRVTFPDGKRPVSGTVTAIGAVASSAGSETPTIPVSIAVRVARGYEQEPVQVSIVVARRRHVLTVPVTALVASLGGGYAVRVIRPQGTRPVRVTPGLYDDAAGAVEVDGAGLRAGMRVEVPAP